MEEKQFNYLKRELIKIESMVKDIYDSTSKKKICPVCQNEIRLYLPFATRKNAMCPVCHSLERHRALWIFLQNNQDIRNMLEYDNLKILHFAPENALMNKFMMMEGVDYWPVDFNEQFPGIRKKVDITDIPFGDNEFDLIICNHVLEHIKDDDRALQELYRVLKSNGIAIINIPIFKRFETTFENSALNTDELRLKHYGQIDHVRCYGNDYLMRFENSGFKVKVYKPNELLDETELYIKGLQKGEIINLCHK